MTEHTAGPWKFDGGGFDSYAAEDLGTDGYFVYKPLEDDHFQAICTLDFLYHSETRSERDDEARANARLIAAAPDLLTYAILEQKNRTSTTTEAAKGLYEYAKKLGWLEDMPLSQFIAEYRDMVIKKAMGRK